MDYIRREDVQANPNKIFVFGDNIMREGLGGQAKEMRGADFRLNDDLQKGAWIDNSVFIGDNQLATLMKLKSTTC